MTATALLSLRERVLQLKLQRKAVILAHNYQVGEIQDIADFVGDSLGLSRSAAKTNAKVILFCGVHFMAETAAILCPDKKVLIPDLEAGCSLAATIDEKALSAWKQEHPDAVVVCYVNTSAAVKAESDVCCTSTNALAVIASIPENKEILFVPDMYLGQWLKMKTGRPIHLWPGSCHAHVRIRPERICELKREHPDAEFLMHPECGCLSASLPLADAVLSTDGILKHAKISKAREFIIGTEVGILHRLKKENPDKTFYAASEEAFCEFMKKNTLEKALWSLEDMKYEVRVPADIAARARKAIERMMDLVD